MSDDLPRRRMEIERLRYQWYTNYDREDEYDMSPDWAIDMRIEETERERQNYTKPEVRLYCDDNPEYEWITSDTMYDLVRVR